MEVFNGICGAESGSVPVSAVAPALLVSQIEIQRKERSQDRPPYLSRPSTEVQK
jgi:TldD protein